MKTALLYFLFLASLATARAQYGRVIHISPDEKLEAVVTPTYIHERGFNEHRVEIRTLHGKRLALTDHSSADHEHGQGVIFASWTPDSRFFVYSVSSSGGHSAWHFPTYVFVRERAAFFYLDELARPFVTPQFQLYPPNRFVSEARNDKGVDYPNEAVELKLQDVKWPKIK